MFVQVYINNTPQTIPYKLNKTIWNGLTSKNKKTRDKNYDKIYSILATFLPDWNHCGINHQRQFIFANAKGVVLDKNISAFI